MAGQVDFSGLISSSVSVLRENLPLLLREMQRQAPAERVKELCLGDDRQQLADIVLSLHQTFCSIGQPSDGFPDLVGRFRAHGNGPLLYLIADNLRERTERFMAASGAGGAA